MTNGFEIQSYLPLTLPDVLFYHSIQDYLHGLMLLAKLPHQIKCFPDLLDLFHVFIWKIANGKCFEEKQLA